MPKSNALKSAGRTIPNPDPNRKPNGLGYKAGPGTKLTPEMQTTFIEFLKKGNYITTTCAAVGISPYTYQSWRRKGKAQDTYDDDGNIIESSYPDTIYGNFMRAVDKAQAEAEIHAVSKIRDAFDDDWRAAESFLARKFPQRWNPKMQMEVTGKDGGAIEVQAKRQALFEQLDTIHVEVLETVPNPKAVDPDSEPEQLSLLGEN